FGELSTGAADDLAKVTDIARDMAMRYGMVEELGHVVFEAPRPRFLDVPGMEAPGWRGSPETQQRIDTAVHDIVQQAFDRSRALLEGQREVLERGARELLTRETLDEAALCPLAQAMRGAGMPPAR
ncbi:MAG: cell division protein FtsH, partial [Rhodoferax sp.]|nr:cell division protein FtsH [Rhodoferax sp.]